MDSSYSMEGRPGFEGEDAKQAEAEKKKKQSQRRKVWRMLQTKRYQCMSVFFNLLCVGFWRKSLNVEAVEMLLR